MSIVWSFVNSVPLPRKKFNRCGICSRSDGTFGLSRRKWTLSNVRKTTRLASQSLGSVAAMLEAGVPVVYFYISDAHDNELGPSLSPKSTFGPGEAPYVQQLKIYDEAFAKFFDRLAKDGITKENTLFVVTADENDHFVGSAPSPANCDGVNVPCTYTH